MCYNCKYTVISTKQNPYISMYSIQEIRSRYPSHDGRYHDYKSTFEAEMDDDEPEAGFPPVESIDTSYFNSPSFYLDLLILLINNRQMEGGLQGLIQDFFSQRGEILACSGAPKLEGSGRGSRKILKFTTSETVSGGF